jgi:hypothetical protein
LNAVLVLHPTASASCCRVIVTTVTTTTPSNAIAATIAITANDVVLLFFILKLQSAGFTLWVSTSRLQKIGGPAKFQSYEEIRFFSFVFSLYQHVSNIIVTRATLEWPKITNDTVLLNKLYRGVFAKFIKLQANLSRVLYEAGIEPHDIFFNQSWMLTPEVIYDGKIVTHKFNLPKDRVNLVVDIAWSIGAPFARCASEKLGRNVDVDPYPDKWSAAGGWEHAFGYWLNEQSKQQQEQQQQHKRK